MLLTNWTCAQNHKVYDDTPIQIFGELGRALSRARAKILGAGSRESQLNYLVSS